MAITTTTTTSSGQAFAAKHQVVTVHNGSRGSKGTQGNKGDGGDTGEGINILGAWITGTIYCPNDAVSWRSSMVSNINSLYIQRTDQPCSASTASPNDDPSRWDEIGAIDWANAFGGIWNVHQIDHGFTMVGQPAGYSFQSDSYVLADSRNLDELGICVVREVVDANHVILQSSGGVPNIDDRIIYPPGSSWEAGRVYYVGIAQGTVSRTPPTATSYYSNPILVVADITGSNRNGIALPWTPTGGPGTGDYITVGWTKYYFIPTLGDTTLSGADLDSNVLAYMPGPNLAVFIDGNLAVDGIQYMATDGVDIDLSTPALAGIVYEVWTPDRPLDIVVPSTVVKLDNIEAQFDGVTTVFAMEVSSLPVAITNTMNTMVWLDATCQEPEVDYTVIPDVGVPANGTINFPFPPEEGTRFWGTVFVPIP